MLQVLPPLECARFYIIYGSPTLLACQACWSQGGLRWLSFA